MKKGLCIECQDKPIFVKKRGLCSSCYQRFRLDEIKGGNRLRNVIIPEESREIIFIKNFFTHKNWIHHPAVFRLNGGEEKYYPDFYDIERDVWIEVAGSRQAYHQNKEKYEIFKKTFPTLKFEVRIPTGELLDDK